MTYYGAKELAESFRTVRKNTIQIAEDIPEDKYDFRATPDTRSVAQMLAHIALATRVQQYTHERKVTDMRTIPWAELFNEFRAEEARPRTKAELLAFLKSEGETYAKFLDGVSDAFLGEMVTLMPGAQPATKSRFEMILGAKEHEMHHRAQLMLVERMIGLVPHLTRQMQERMAAMNAAAQAQR
jgi:uncharacterized damage-inducible protein DinB